MDTQKTTILTIILLSIGIAISVYWLGIVSFYALIAIICFLAYLILLFKKPIIGLSFMLFLAIGTDVRWLFDFGLNIGSLSIPIFDLFALPFIFAAIIRMLKTSQLPITNWKYIASLSLFPIAIIGTINGFYNNSLFDVLRESRDILYFIVLILIVGTIVTKKKDLALLEKVIIFSGLTISIWIITYFFSKAYAFGLISQAVLRTGSLFQYTPAIAAAFLGYDQIKKRCGFPILAAISLQVLFLTATILSLTRSAWIYYIIVAASLLLVIFFQKKTFNYIKNYIKIFFCIFLGMIVVLLLALFLLPKDYLTDIESLITNRILTLRGEGPENTFLIRLDTAREGIESMRYPTDWLFGKGFGAGFGELKHVIEIIPVWYLFKLGFLGFIIGFILYATGIFSPIFYLTKAKVIKEEIFKWFLAIIPLFLIGSFTGIIISTPGIIISSLFIGINWRHIDLFSPMTEQKEN